MNQISLSSLTTINRSYVNYHEYSLSEINLLTFALCAATTKSNFSSASDFTVLQFFSLYSKTKIFEFSKS